MFVQAHVATHLLYRQHNLDAKQLAHRIFAERAPFDGTHVMHVDRRHSSPCVKVSCTCDALCHQCAGPMHALPCRFVESSVGFLSGLASTAELVPLVRQHRDRMLTKVMLIIANHLAVVSTLACANAPCNTKGFMIQSSIYI